jgi:hypothetical protein
MSLHPSIGLKVFFAGAVLAASVSPAWGQTTVHCYRHVISTKIGDDEYRDEVPNCDKASGGYAKVERDTQNRIVSVTGLRDGKVTGKTRNKYAGTAALPYGDEDWQDGELKGTTHYERNATGLTTRAESRTAQGVLTGYTVYSDTPEYLEFFSYGSDGNRTGHGREYYSPQGLLIRSISYMGQDSGYIDKLWDEQTGLALSAKQFKNGNLLYTDKYSYGPEGDLVRMDGYRTDGTWFAADEYQHGLRSKRIYKMANGANKEIRYTYDEKRWLAKAEVVYQDKLICALKYDRAEDGTVRRTLAVGPDGSLWAEYPAPAVFDIESSGSAVNRTDGTIHHSGNWW